MGKFSVVTKEMRGRIQERKRAIHGDPITGKLKQRTYPNPISGKRKRKLFKKWRREQKEAVQKGLITMEDVEMAVAEGTAAITTKKAEKSEKRFNVKKNSRVQIRKLKGKGKRKGKSIKPTASDSTGDAMEE